MIVYAFRTTRVIHASLVNTRDQKYAYDGLHRLTTFEDGTLTAGSITSTQFEEDYTLDQLSNWPAYVMKAPVTTTRNQQRYHNAVNESDANGGNSITSSGGTPNWADPASESETGVIKLRPLLHTALMDPADF